ARSKQQLVLIGRIRHHRAPGDKGERARHAAEERDNPKNRIERISLRQYAKQLQQYRDGQRAAGQSQPDNGDVALLEPLQRQRTEWNADGVAKNIYEW